VHSTNDDSLAVMSQVPRLGHGRDKACIDI